ncbi:MAG TPA: hypothetical protein VNE62_01925 [Actinomycetota bacterium]|nr:hypothetical protein [Actinomycetota bacterium]
MQQATVLLVDASAERRGFLRSALENRGWAVTGEAGNIAELINACAELDSAPATVLVGATFDGTSSVQVARMIKRTWPKATVVREMRPEDQAVQAPVLRIAASA